MQQCGRSLQGGWWVANGLVGLEIEGYRPGEPLLIDPPVRAWGTYYGGSGDDDGYAVAIDASENVYLAGGTSSSNAIATSGAHQELIASGPDASLVKFSAAGQRLWGTYYGGSGSDDGYSCVVGSGGEVYMSGTTDSSGGISGGSNPHQPNYAGTGDAFLVKFASDGVRQWGTYYGGTDWEYSSGYCALDGSGHVYLVGRTYSDNGIASANAYQTSRGGCLDAFIAKFRTSDGQRVLGTYYGGSNDNEARACAADPSGNVYIVGFTMSLNGIATSGAHQTNPRSYMDAFIVKFDASGQRQWGTYYGGDYDDVIEACVTDASGDLYVAGKTGSSNNIAGGSNPHQIGYGGNTTDGFLAKFSPSGTRIWGTYYGETGVDAALACTIDGSGNIYIAGKTTSTSQIATLGAYQTTKSDEYEGFVAKFRSDGRRVWGTYYGGNRPSSLYHDDAVYGCAVNASGTVVYIGGITESTQGIASSGSHQPTHGGGTNNYLEDAFLAKLTDSGGPSALPLGEAGGGVAIYQISGQLVVEGDLAQARLLRLVDGLGRILWSVPIEASGPGDRRYEIPAHLSAGAYIAQVLDRHGALLGQRRLWLTR